MSDLERLEDETNIETLTVVGDTDAAAETEPASLGTAGAEVGANGQAPKKKRRRGSRGGRGRKKPNGGPKSTDSAAAADDDEMSGSEDWSGAEADRGVGPKFR